MVIEDDPDCLEAVVAVLEHAGHVVITATDGAEALRVLASGPAPDVILLDLMLPVMTGWEFLAEQRARPELAKIPVVLMSGERDLRRRGSEAGVAGAIAKPLELEELISTVRRIIAPPEV